VKPNTHTAPGVSPRGSSSARQPWARIVGPTDGRPRPRISAIPLSSAREPIFSCGPLAIGAIRVSRNYRMEFAIRYLGYLPEGCARIQGQVVERGILARESAGRL